MAKQFELNKQKGKATGQWENRPVWNNVQRMNHQNKFVPKAVLTKTGIFPVNTARQNLSSQAATTSIARKINITRPIVNKIRPRSNFYRSHSPIRKPSNRTTTPKVNFANNKVNTIGDKTISAIGGNRETAVDPQKALKNKGIFDSGCSRHMTENNAYLVEYQDYNGGSSKGQITSKELLKTELVLFDTKMSRMQKTDSDLEEEEHLKTFPKLVLDEEGIIDYEVLEKRFPIINWESKFYHLDRHGAKCIYYRIFRSDESSRWIKTFSEMVTMFDRLDLEELYNLVMQRFESTTPEGVDLIL
ncbi:hypothetical protein Tco_1443304 [Tanacetum coccineum]